jgi:hypothetical protein
LRILLGQLHAENGQAEDGVQMLQEAILFAQSHGMQFYVAIAQRRLAYVKVSLFNIWPAIVI